MASPDANALVTRELAGELARVLQRFALEAGFGDGGPVGIFFRPGVVGHHQLGRAADIYAVDGIGIEEWKRRWDAALGKAPHPAVCRSRARREGMSNLGWRLYKALQLYGRWAQPYGYPVQLFGPWTRREGPWRFISDGLLDAHRDHIHVAK